MENYNGEYENKNMPFKRKIGLKQTGYSQIYFLQGGMRGLMRYDLKICNVTSTRSTPDR